MQKIKLLQYKLLVFQYSAITLIKTTFYFKLKYEKFERKIKTKKVEIYKKKMAESNLYMRD